MATVFQFDGEKKQTTKKHKRKTNNKHAHSQDCWMFTIISFAVCGENMYMSMTEPSQDYVPASQGGLINLLCLVSEL